MNAHEMKSPGSLSVPRFLKTLMPVMIFLGFITMAICLVSPNPTLHERAWHSYLIGFFYTVSLALGGLFFVAVQFMTKAGWSVTIRRFAEAFTAFLGYAVVLALVYMFVGSFELYSWLDPKIVASDVLLQHKSPYLNSGFFWIRTGVFFAIWLWFAHRIVGASLRQDQSGEDEITNKLVGPSVAFLLLFAFSYSFFSVDALMSLEPHWFSTIFGIYTFAGLFQSTLALLVIFVLALMKTGQLKGFVSDHHLHDLGKFLFAFTVFWAYIAFSQYMLIWYANLPEETIFFEPRSEGAWALVSLSLLVFKFIVPFLMLLPKWAKRSAPQLGFVASLILIMQYVDIYWLVYPNVDHHHVIFGWVEILVFLGFVGLFLLAVTRFLAQHQVVPIRDPRIHEALHHEVTY